MNALAMIFFAFSAYGIGYLLYSRYLAEKVFCLDDSRKTPAHELRDDVDYVPTNRWILLGHHFTSITGAGPIVGPAIAVIWGWLPAFLWVVLGAVVIGAVHDFSALVTSIRHRGRSVGTILGDYAGERARVLFLLLILALAILVNGYSVYRFRVNFLIPTLLFLGILYLAVFVGARYPVSIKPVSETLGVDAIMLWIVVLFIYTFFASSLPVWLLLQPRDFLNGLQLVILLFLMYAGAVVANPEVKAPLINLNLIPFLFITIACGALSGFHALVSSGTTSKQLAREKDARTVGYLGFLGESSLAVAVIIACTAGLGTVSAQRFSELYGSWESIKVSPVPAVVEGPSVWLLTLPEPL